MSWPASLCVGCIAGLIVIALFLAFAPGKPRNRRRSHVLGAPHPHCQRNYVP